MRSSQRPLTANSKPQTHLWEPAMSRLPQKQHHHRFPRTNDDSNYFFAASGLILLAASARAASTVAWPVIACWMAVRAARETLV